MVFYNNQKDNSDANPKPQTAEKGINNLELALQTSPLYRSMFPKQPKTPQKTKEDLTDNYFAVMRQPTYLEKKANPKVKSIISKIIDTQNPYRNISPEDFGIEKNIEDNNTPNILTIDGAKEYKKQQKAQQQNQWFVPTKKRYDTKNSLYVTDSAGDYLFKLKGENEKVDTITAKELYKEKKQWFAPEADDYMPIIDINDKITENKNIKHVSSDDVFKFADTPRGFLEYKSGGSGDWKAQKEGADGYLMTTVDKKPYWADAVGQVPFAIDTYKNGLKFTENKETIKNSVKYIGGIAAQGGLINSAIRAITNNPDTTNSYDNHMIKKATNWAEKKYNRKNTDTLYNTTITSYPDNPIATNLHLRQILKMQPDTTTHSIKNLFDYDTKHK